MRHLALIVFVLLIAASTRLVMLDDVGLQHDEIFKAQEGQLLIEQGDLRFFYPSNQGHEGAYVWILGLSYLLFGVSLVMVKFPPLVCGMLTVALLYRVSGEIFNRRVAFIAAGLAAVSFWTVYTNRVGLRANLLPVVTLLVIWGVHRLLTSSKNTSLTAILTGLALGFAIYTYTSSFVLYLAFGALLVTLLLFHRVTLQRHWRQWAVVTIVGVLLVLPMVHLRFTDPTGQDRVSTITRPWNDFRAGKPAELIDNAVKLAGMPAFTGDPEWRYNVAERPLFLLPIGLLVYVGLGLSVWRIRKQPIHSMFLTLALLGLVPSLLTVSAPSFLRSIITMPSIFIFVGLALDLIPVKRWVWIAGGVVVIVTGTADSIAYFTVWTRNEEVHSIYRDDLQQLARFAGDQQEAFLLVSTSNTELDPFIYPYYQPPQTPQVVFFDGRTNLALSLEPALLLVSPLSPISPPHQPRLMPENGVTPLEPLLRQDGGVAFEVYQLPPVDLGALQQPSVYIYNEVSFPQGQIGRWAEPIPYPVNFGNRVELVGLELPRTRIASQFDGVNLQLYLHPLVERVDEPLNIFVHMSKRDGTVHAQRDLMGLPSLQWDDDLIFVQDNFVIAGPTEPGQYIITMGIYNYQTGERLPVLNSAGEIIADRLVVGRVRVVQE